MTEQLAVIPGARVNRVLAGVERRAVSIVDVWPARSPLAVQR